MEENIYKYYIFKDKNLVIEILKGRFEISEYVKLKHSQSEAPDYNPNYNLILDIRGIKDNLSEEIIKEYTQRIKPVQFFTTRIKAAIITNTPSHVTGAILYKLFEVKSVNCQIFSTIEHALTWLGFHAIEFKELFLIFNE